MKADAEEFTKNCDSCQRFALVIRSLAELLSSVGSPYPFMKLAMDVMGPFPQASEQMKFVLAITYYYSKWVKVEAFA